ncbi:DUF2249 domain-containing protein [Undibacterium sp. SXout11W]|uniref:DUF2249 domain-containing protein n=1 Tax=Undibacterium sp. SXout11W TaxID=3413050 RepID=UPI003BF08B36
MTHDCSTPIISEGTYAFDARGIAKRFRHAAIFGALNALLPGETMRFCNDHNPLPLLTQIEQYFGDRVTISYVSKEPGEIVIDFVVAH